MTDMDALMKAADALADALSESRDAHCAIAEHILQQGPASDTRGIFADSQRARLAIDRAQLAYRAAREAVGKPTPPAYATSA